MSKYHFIGIGGIGMSGLAHILLEKKMQVSGSDLRLGPHTQNLSQKGAHIFEGHAPHHVASGDTIVLSSGIHPSNPEYLAALALECPVLHRSELLAELMSEHEALAVAGTHGKTTTTALLVAVLTEAGLDPSFAVGGVMKGGNGKFGAGKFFIAEADESDGSFVRYFPKGAIITNVEPEHLNHYQSFAELKKAFQSFASNVSCPDWLFYCGDDPHLPAIMNGKGIAYGFGEESEVRLKNCLQKGWQMHFDLEWNSRLYPNVSVNLVGRHNALNAAAVFGLALTLGIEETVVRHALSHFTGVERRCEKKGEVGGVLFLDDYAHHPTEIQTTLQGVREAIQEKRLVGLFQPHRYTRTRDLFHEFSLAFSHLDHLFVTDVYAAGEAPIEGISGETLAKSIRNLSPTRVSYLPREKLVQTIQDFLRPHDVLITIGAGDITHLHPHLMANWSPKKYEVGLLFGGRSDEHEISLRSARFVDQNLNPELYNVTHFYIDKEGHWTFGRQAQQILSGGAPVCLEEKVSFLHPDIAKEIEKCELFVPILHGPFGEDGTLQGMFEMLGKPYVGPNHRTAAIAMDKALTKRIVAASGVKTPKDVTLRYLDWCFQKEDVLLKVTSTLRFPLYVKPIALGSSIGISYVKSSEELSSAIEKALVYDLQVIVEEAVEGARELEFAVLGNTLGHSVQVPAPGEKIASGSFVDYEKKYGQQPVASTVSVELSPGLVEKGKELAYKAYCAVGGSGLTRVDFLLDSYGEFWFFEMNTLPGMQALSLFPKIWQREGLAGEALLNRLIALALEQNRLSVG